MMKHNSKLIILVSLCLAILMIVPIFAGCSGKKPVDSGMVDQKEADKGNNSTIPKAQEVNPGDKLNNDITPRIAFSNIAKKLKTEEVYSTNFTMYAEEGDENKKSGNLQQMSILVLVKDGATYLEKNSLGNPTDKKYQIIKGVISPIPYAMSMNFEGAKPVAQKTYEVPEFANVDILYNLFYEIYKTAPLNNASVKKVEGTDNYQIEISLSEFWPILNNNFGSVQSDYLDIMTFGKDDKVTIYTDGSFKLLKIATPSKYIVQAHVATDSGFTKTVKFEMSINAVIRYGSRADEVQNIRDQENFFNDYFFKRFGKNPLVSKKDGENVVNPNASSDGELPDVPDEETPIEVTEPVVTEPVVTEPIETEPTEPIENNTYNYSDISIISASDSQIVFNDSEGVEHTASWLCEGKYYVMAAASYETLVTINIACLERDGKEFVTEFELIKKETSEVLELDAAKGNDKESADEELKNMLQSNRLGENTEIMELISVEDKMIDDENKRLYSFMDQNGYVVHFAQVVEVDSPMEELGKYEVTYNCESEINYETDGQTDFAYLCSSISMTPIEDTEP